MTYSVSKGWLLVLFYRQRPTEFGVECERFKFVEGGNSVNAGELRHSVLLRNTERVEIALIKAGDIVERRIAQNLLGKPYTRKAPVAA